MTQVLGSGQIQVLGSGVKVDSRILVCGERGAHDLESDFHSFTWNLPTCSIETELQILFKQNCRHLTQFLTCAYALHAQVQGSVLQTSWSACDEDRFYNSGVTNLSCVRIVIEMGSHLTRRVPVQSHNSILDQKSRKVIVSFHRNQQCENTVLMK